MADIKCPQCDRSWPDGCEQTACIELLGSCIVCNKDDINQHLPEIQRRMSANLSGSWWPKQDTIFEKENNR